MPESIINIENWDTGLPSVNEDILPDCPPTKIDQKDFSKVMGHSQEEIDALNIERFYTSQLIGLQALEEPPYEIFKKEPSTLEGSDIEKMDDFIAKFMSLRDGGDKCDKVGIKFIGKLLNYYCPNNANFKLLPQFSQGFIKSSFSYPSNENVVMEHAIKWSNCSYKKNQ